MSRSLVAGVNQRASRINCRSTDSSISPLHHYLQPFPGRRETSRHPARLCRTLFVAGRPPANAMRRCKILGGFTSGFRSWRSQRLRIPRGHGCVEAEVGFIPSCDSSHERMPPESARLISRRSGISTSLLSQTRQINLHDENEPCRQLGG